MQVETFECTETAAEPIEACEEAVGIIEQMGLAGQLALVRPAADGKPQTRCPYREMTADEAYVYGVLCPEHTALKHYKNSPIPLRVLQIAAHAQSLGMFEKLVVWDRKEAVVKDPVLVGEAPGLEYKWAPRRFILARWGEELETFVVLTKRAYQSKREQFVDALRRVKNSIESRIAVASEMSDEDLRALGPNATAELKIG